MSTVTIDPDIHDQGEPWPAHVGEAGADGDPHVVVRTADTADGRRAVARIAEAWTRVDSAGVLRGPFADHLAFGMEMAEAGGSGYVSVSRLADGFLLYADTDGEHTRSMMDGFVRVAADLLQEAGVTARLSAPSADERNGGQHVTDEELEAWAG